MWPRVRVLVFVFLNLCVSAFVCYCVRVFVWLCVCLLVGCLASLSLYSPLANLYKMYHNISIIHI